MPTLSFGGWSFGVPLASWLNQAMLLSRDYNLDQLGATTFLKNQRITEMMNWTTQEILETQPDLAKSSDTVSLPNASTYGSNTVAIPATMYGQDIVDMVFSDSSQANWQLGSHCLFLDRAPWDMLPVEWKNGTTTVRNPKYWTFDDTSQNQLFAPYPNDTTCQLTRTFRVNPTVITPVANGSMLISGTSLGNVVSNTTTTVTMTDTSTLAANGWLTINFTGGPETYQIASVTNATTVVLMIATSTSATAAGYKATVIGEMPVRFKNIWAYRLAAFFCEETNFQLSDMLMQKYQASGAELTKQITKQIASWNAGYANQPAQNQLFNAQACFPYVSPGVYVAGY